MAESRRRGRRRQATSAATFATFAVVAAFLVSAIAGIVGDTPPDPVPPEARTLAPGETVRVEVLNGAGTSGLAREATHRLRGDGFDVVFFGNAPRFGQPRSVVLDRAGDPARARAVARALGIDSVAAAPDPSLLLDVSVVLGADWPPRSPERVPLAQRLRDMVGRHPAR